MSAIAYPDSEPYKLPAGMLALAVHIAFFIFLYFGVSWQTQPPQGMVVDIWESLPAPEVEPEKVEPQKIEPPKIEPAPVEPPPPPKPVEPVRPVTPPKADIELSEKKKPKPKPVEAKKVEEVTKKVEVKKPVEVKQEAPQISEAERAAQAAQAEQARLAAQAAAAVTSEIGKYTGLIRSKIRRFIVLPPDVPDSVKAEFEVTLLPDGEVLGDPKLIKSSGNAAYDSAVERAILKAQPLPLPPDGPARKAFINPNKLQLKVTPKE